MPKGSDASSALKRLIAIKDKAQYGIDDISGQALASALRQAQSLVAFADNVLQR